MSIKSEQIARIIASMKGESSSGLVLSDVVGKIEGLVAAMEPGDFVRSATNTAVTAPVSHDFWYLFFNDNLLKKYRADEADADFKHYDYSTDLTDNYSFLSALTGLKPLKVLTDLKAQLVAEVEIWIDEITSQYENNGIYWINTIAFELWRKGLSAQYSSDGPKDFKPNDYVGYISFPIGQLGTMEVVSILQETALSGYKLTEVDDDASYLPKAAPTLKDEEKPSLQSTPLMFPDMKDANGNALAGQNYCYGRHMIESGYLVPETPVPNQNSSNSEGTTAYAPTPSRDVELFSSKMEKYTETVEPKKWMRYWIHKDDTLPVPGEFIGILCR